MYKTVIILVEGQSEETFIRDTVSPAFWPLNRPLSKLSHFKIADSSN